MEEAQRIITGAAQMPAYHGSTTIDVVDRIMEICGGQVMCCGHLREFEFEKVTNKSFKFKTVDWYDKTYPKRR